MILFSSVFIIKILLSVVTTLDNNTINLGAVTIANSKKPEEKKHWYKNVRFSSPGRINIQEVVRIIWFTKLEEVYANSISSEIQKTRKDCSSGVGSRHYSITFKMAQTIHLTLSRCERLGEKNSTCYDLDIYMYVLCSRYQNKN